MHGADQSGLPSNPARTRDGCACLCLARASTRSAPRDPASSTVASAPEDAHQREVVSGDLRRELYESSVAVHHLRAVVDAVLVESAVCTDLHGEPSAQALAHL